MPASIIQFGLGNLFGGGDDSNRPSGKVLRTEPKPDAYEPYEVPKERARGRPHELGWLQFLDDENQEKFRLGQVPPGRIIPDDE